MLARAITLGISTLAALALAASAGAVTGQIVVTPTSPTVGKNASIRVQITQRVGERLPSILYLRVISPRGGALRVPLTRAGKSTSTWKTAFSFADKGTWRLRVIAGKGGSPKAGSVLGGTTVVVQKH